MSRLNGVRIPDGYMIPGPHATTAKGNQQGQTTSSNYLLKSEGNLGLIDTGMHLQGVEELIEHIDASDGKLRWIVLTHFHYDHIGNAATLAHRYGCVVLAHPLDIPAIENPLRIAGGSWGFHEAGSTIKEVYHEFGEERKEGIELQTIEKYFNFPVRVDRALEEGDDLELGAWRLRVLHTPGHSPGSISLLNPATRSLYIGDLDYCMNPSNCWPIGNASDLIESMQRVLNLESIFLGPGHHLGIFQKGAVHEYLEEMLQRALTIGQRVELCLKRMGPATIDQLTEEVFPIIPRYAYSPIPKNVVHCFLHKLQHERKARKIRQHRVILWKEA